MTKTLLRTWNPNTQLEEWVHPQDGVFWGHCEDHGPSEKDAEDWVAYTKNGNLCATCDRNY